MTGGATAPHGAAQTIAGFTPITLIVIAAFAVLVVIGMIYGARLRSQRHAAQREEERRVEHASQTSRDADTPKRDAEPTKERADTPPATPTKPVPAPATDPAREPPAGSDEPVPAAAPYEASPATLAHPEPAPVAKGDADGDAPVTTLKGLGAKVAARLAELDITRIGQIAALSPDDATALDAQLGAFKGRMARDRWIDQAKLLTAGDRAGFEREFGKL